MSNNYNEPLDNTQFLKIINEIKQNQSGSCMALTDMDRSPYDIGSGNLMFGGWRVHVQSFVHPEADAGEVIEGWDCLLNRGITSRIIISIFIWQCRVGQS